MSRFIPWQERHGEFRECDPSFTLEAHIASLRDCDPKRWAELNAEWDDPVGRDAQLVEVRS